MWSALVPALCTDVSPQALNSCDMWRMPLRARSRRCSGVKVSLLTDPAENAACILGDASVQLAVLLEESAILRIGVCAVMPASSNALLL